MKRYLIHIMSAALAAGVMIPFVSLSASAASAKPHTSRLSYEDCVYMAECLGKDVDEVLALRYESNAPSKYIALVSAKNNTYSSGSVTMSLEYNTTYLTRTGYTSGSNGSLISLDDDSITGSSSWRQCSGEASLHTSADNDRSNLIFSLDFDAVPGKEDVVQWDIFSGLSYSFDNLQLSSATINGAHISSSEYSTYFETGFKPLGDVDEDLELTTDDALCILEHIGHIETFDATWKYAAADFNRDGCVDISDVNAIYSYLAGSSV